MAEHKLISLCLETPDKITISITLLKEVSHYKIRTEYLKEDDKIKETNNEVERNFVYQLFCDLEAADFESLDDHEGEAIGYLKVFYGSHDYLERHFNKTLLQKSNELKRVIISLLEFVDNSIDKKKLLG